MHPCPCNRCCSWQCGAFDVRMNGVSPQSVAAAIAHASQVTMPNLTTAATGRTTLTTIIALLTSPTAITAANRAADDEVQRSRHAATAFGPDFQCARSCRGSIRFQRGVLLLEIPHLLKANHRAKFVEVIERRLHRLVVGQLVIDVAQCKDGGEQARCRVNRHPVTNFPEFILAEDRGPAHMKLI